MSAEIVTMLGGFATLFASGGTFAMFMFRLFVRLESRVDALAGEVSELRGDLTALSREVSELRGDLTVLSREVSELRGEVVDLRGGLTALSREVSELRGEFRGRFGAQPAVE